MSSFNKSIRVFGGVSILTGIIVGSGIFFVGSLVLNVLNYSTGFALLAWLIGGLLTLSYAWMYAQIGAHHPKVGGYYAYLRASYGPLVGFMAGFFNFVLASSGSIAVLALAFSEVSHNILLTAFGTGLEPWMQIALAAVMIVLLTGMNILGVKLNTTFLKVIMVIKFIPIIGLIFLGIFAGTQPLELNFSLGGVGFFEGLSLIGFAVIFTFWAYEGWTNLNSVSEEMENPTRDLPKALTITIGMVIAVYVLYQASIFRALDVATIEEIFNSGFLFIGIPATMALVGDVGVFIVMGTIFIAILGALNATILSFSRVYFAVAQDFPKLHPLATLDERRQTPVKALLFSALMALVLVPFQIGDLISLVAFGGLVFNTLVFLSIFKTPQEKGVFKTPLYPYLPVVSIGITVLLLVAIFIQSPYTSLIGVGVIALAIPVYHFIK